jgi:hypothetical protein
MIHRKEELPVLLADVVELADIGMIEAGGGPGFAPKAFLRAAVCGLPPDRLDRHAPIQTLVVSGIDHTHATRPDKSLNSVRPDSPPDGE